MNEENNKQVTIVINRLHKEGLHVMADVVEREHQSNTDLQRQLESVTYNLGEDIQCLKEDKEELQARVNELRDFILGFQDGAKENGIILVSAAKVMPTKAHKAKVADLMKRFTLGQAL